MDYETLKRFIQSVAEIREKKPKGSPSLEIVDYDEDGEPIYEVVDSLKDNDTFGYEIVKIKQIKKLCDLGCGDVVANQVIEKRFCEGPEPHWRTRCQTCGAYKHPSGQGFIEGAHQVAAEYVKWFNYLNSKSKTKDKIPVGTNKSNAIKSTKNTHWVKHPDGRVEIVSLDKENSPEN